MNLKIVPGILVCSSFQISVGMCIVSKALLISSATVIVRAGGAIWLNPFATVYMVCLLLCKEEGRSILLRGGIWACMRCPCLCL